VAKTPIAAPIMAARNATIAMVIVAVIYLPRVCCCFDVIRREYFSGAAKVFHDCSLAVTSLVATADAAPQENQETVRLSGTTTVQLRPFVSCMFTVILHFCSRNINGLACASQIIHFNL
jgi:hypothetical protein